MTARYKKKITALVIIAVILVLQAGVFFTEIAYGAIDRMSFRVAVARESEPLLFIDDAGNVNGALKDIMDLIAENCNVDLEYITYPTEWDAIYALDKEHCDILLGFVSHAQHNERLCMTTSIFTANLCLAARTEEAQALISHPNPNKYYDTAYEVNTATYSSMGGVNCRNIKVVAGQDKLWEQLVSGDSDLIFAVRECAEYHIRNDRLGKEYQIPVHHISNINYTLLVRKKSTLLYNILNQSISEIKSSGDYDKIISKWIIDPSLHKAEGRITILFFVLGAVLIICILITGGIAFTNRKLKVMVAEKTAEITDQMHNLEKADALQKIFIEHSTGGSILTDRDGAVLYMSPDAYEMSGIKNTRDLNIQEMPIFGAIWNLGMHDMNHPKTMTIKNKRGGNSVYKFQCVETRKKNQYVVLADDVTYEENKKIEAFEEGKNRALNRMIAGIAHEIKNPLTTIKTYSSLIKEHGNNPEFQDEMSRYVPPEVDRISKMIENLIHYAKPSQGQNEIISIETLVNDCLGIAYISRTSDVIIDTEIDHDLFIYAKREHIRQAIVNMLLNSVESLKLKRSSFASKGKEHIQDYRIKVSACKKNGKVIIDVYDNGLGISEEEIALCADPFFTTKETGTGMGLSVSKQMIQGNGGKLQISSEYGQWANFRMIFMEAKSET